MYKINNHIVNEKFEGLKVHRLSSTDAFEILSISLEKGVIFPEHSSPSEAHLLVLEGDIDFHIDQKKYRLTKNQFFNFPKEEPHWVESNMDSKFLIIR